MAQELTAGTRLGPDEILDVVVHEVANEATVIAGLASALERRWDHLDDAGRRELAERLARQADRLVVVVRNLRGLRGLELRDLPVERTRHEDTARLLVELVHDLAPLAHRHRLDLRVRGDLPAVEVDVRLLQQVLANLLANAAAAAPPGTAITVTATAAPDRRRVVVDVDDRGPGIPCEQRQAVLRPGTRLRGGQGLGLGLYVCEELLSALGGTIAVHDGPDGGARLRVELPAAPAVTA